MHYSSIRIMGALCLMMTGGLLVISACAPADRRPPADPAPATTDDTPRDRLLRLARVEQSTSSEPRADISPPPNIDARTLTPAAPQDIAAFMSFEQAVAAIVDMTALPANEPPVTPRAVTNEAQDQALRHYVRGRDESDRGRFLMAVTELERAREIDPDSVPVLRQLARAYNALSNTTAASRHYQRLLAFEPDDSEAILHLGMAALNQRNIEQAIAMIAPHRMQGAGFGHDPGGNILADYSLAVALRTAGYSAAANEIGRRAAELPDALSGVTLYRNQLTLVYRQRGDLWRQIGDGHLRLEEFPAALDAYSNATQFPVPDPFALLARLLYVNLRLDQPAAAQLVLLDAAEQSMPDIDDRLIQLAVYLNRELPESSAIAGAVHDLLNRNPDALGLTRLAAAAFMTPTDAVALYQGFIERQPDDLDAVGELLQRIAADDPGAAVRLSVSLAEMQPDHARGYADKLLAVAGASPAVFAALAELPDSSARNHVHARLLHRTGDSAGAYHIVQHALRATPGDHRLQTALLEIVGSLQDAELLEQALTMIDADADASVRIAESAAQRRFNRTTAAVSAAERAVEHAPEDPAAWTELARAMALSATHAIDAAEAARQALQLDPQYDPAYEVLLAIFDQNGSSPDQDRYRDVARSLINDHPGSRLLGRLTAMESIGQGRIEAAIERLLPLYESDPTDAEVLNRLIGAWLELRRADVAERWLNQQLEKRPYDPVLLRQWTQLLVQTDRVDEAEQALVARIDQWPGDTVATALLESVYRATGRRERSSRMALERLARRPDTAKRVLEEAGAHAEAGNQFEVIDRLEMIAERSQFLPVEILLEALSLTGLLEQRAVATNAIRVELVRNYVDREPDASISVYGAGLIAMVMLGDTGDAFDALALRAIHNAPEARAGGVREAIALRDLAQTLLELEHPGPAARFTRMRIQRGRGLDDDAFALLAQVTQALFIAADAPNEATRFIDRLQQNGELPRIFLLRNARRPHAEAYYLLSLLSSLLGEDDAAETLLTEAVSIDDANAMAFNNLGYRWIVSGRDDAEAVGMVERAFTLDPDSASIQDTLGWLRYLQGRFEDVNDEAPGALTLIERSLTTDRQAGESPSPEVLDHYGDVLWRLGRPDDAARAWRDAITAIEDPRERERIARRFHEFQVNGWGILIRDPYVIYDAMHRQALESLRRKVRQVDAGETPDIEPTFAERRASASADHD